jgi:hypothetical protein
MTKRLMQWENLNTALNENERYINDLEKYKLVEKEKEELKSKLSKLEDTIKPSIPETFDDLGILSVVYLETIRDCNFDNNFDPECDEGDIVGITNDTLKVRFRISYYTSRTVDVPIKNIKENGYFIVDDKWFICDKLDLDKRKVLLDLVFKHSKEALKSRIEWINGQIERLNCELDDANKMLSKFDNIPESWVRSVLNKLDFSISLGANM